MTTPTPRPASWRSVSLRRSAPTPRGVPKKLIAGLHDMEPDALWPAPSTAGGILDRAGLVQRRRRRRRASPWNEPFAHAITPQRRLVQRLQRLVPPRRRDTRRSPHRAGRGLSLPHRLPGAGAPHRPGDAARVSARLPASTASPRSSGPTTARPSPASAWAASHSLSVVVDQARASSPSASSRDTPNRTGVSSASTVTLKAETASPPRANRRRQRRAFDHFRHSYNNERPHEALGQRPAGQALHPLVPALSITPQLARIRAEVAVRRVRHNGEIKWM